MGIWAPTADNLRESSEAKLLAGLKSKYQKRKIEVPAPTVLKGKNPKPVYLNVITVEPQVEESQSQPKKHDVLLLHGFGAGLGFFLNNLDAIAETGYRVHAVDWLGMGCSDRPAFPTGKNTDESLELAEEFFLQPLESLRQELGLNKVVLMGHSLGGYLSSLYAVRHADRVQELVLISPVGVGQPPEDFEWNRVNWRWRLVRSLWEMNFTPQGAIRFFGPLGPKLVKKYSERRFGHLPAETATMLEDYLYHICAAKGSGEYAMNTILQPGAWARKPLCAPDRLPQLTMRTTFLYGSHDWMDHRHAVKVQPLMKKADVSVKVIPNAGHHLYLDNPTDFNQALTDILDSVAA